MNDEMPLQPSASDNVVAQPPIVGAPMARLTKREILIFVISVVLLAPLVVWGVLFLLGRFFDEPDPLEHAAGTDETTIQQPR